MLFELSEIFGIIFSFTNKDPIIYFFNRASTNIKLIGAIMSACNKISNYFIKTIKFPILRKIA